MKIQKTIILCVLAALTDPSCVIAAPSYNMPIPESAGIINSHDIDLLKNRSRENQEYKDFQELKKREETQPSLEADNISPKNTDEQNKTVIKATASEYATKGVYVERIDITPSEILSSEELSAITDTLKGKNVFFSDIEKAVAAINNIYLEKGYVTAKAFISEQSIENGVLKITLVEGRVGEILISNNKWTKDRYISKRISEKSGDLFEITALENNILNFNRYNEGVNLNANLTPGETEGSTDINIKTTEKLPFHMMGMYDNAGRDTIGILRGGVMASCDSVFGYRDKISAGLYKSRDSITPFADYNVPVNKHDGRIGAMFSSSRAHIGQGNYSMFNIDSRSYNYSLYFNQPIIRKPYFELSSLSSANYKQATTAFDGYDLSTDKITSFQTGLNSRYDTKKGIWYATQSVSHAFPIFDENSKYFKYEGSLIRLHDLGHGIVAQLRGNYQWVPQDVIPYVDQFQAGGLATVRGYSEGLLIGKTGYLLSSEILFPIAPKTIKVKNKKRPFLGSFVKAVYFVDHAGVLPFKGSGPGAEGINGNDFLVSTGLGLRIALPGDLTARLYWGFPLLNNTHEGVSKTGRFHFDLSFAPDFDALLKLRRPKESL